MEAVNYYSQLPPHTAAQAVFFASPISFNVCLIALSGQPKVDKVRLGKLLTAILQNPTLPYHPMSHPLTRLIALITLMLTSLLAGCSATGVLNAVTPSRSYTLSADVAYGTQPRQKLDIYRPTATAPPAGWPVVVFFLWRLVEPG